VSFNADLELRVLRLELDKINSMTAARVRENERMADDLFGVNVEIDNLRKMLADANQRADASLEREQIQLKLACKAIKDRHVVTEVLLEVLAHIEQGRPGTMGEVGRVYTRSISADEIARWRDRIPKTDPHPIEKLVDKTLAEGGQPT